MHPIPLGSPDTLDTPDTQCTYGAKIVQLAELPNVVLTCNTPAVPCGVKKLQRRGCIEKVKRCEAGVEARGAKKRNDKLVHLIRPEVGCGGRGPFYFRRCNSAGVLIRF